MTDQITVRLDRAAAEIRVLRGGQPTLREMILANRQIDEAIREGLDRPPVEDDRVPDVILVCPETGDWIPEEDGPGCPHGIPDDCCEPVTFIRAAPNEAAVKEERERIKARIENLAVEYERFADSTVRPGVTGSEMTEAIATRNMARMVALNLRAALLEGSDQ